MLLTFSTIIWNLRMCRAQNEIGLQEKPCIFHLMPAGKPDPVSNCSVANQSYSTMSVTCKHGFNGGLRQVYHRLMFNPSNEDIFYTSEIMVNHI